MHGIPKGLCCREELLGNICEDLFASPPLSISVTVVGKVEEREDEPELDAVDSSDVKLLPYGI